MIRGLAVLLVTAFLWIAPLPLEPTQHRLAAIFGGVLVAWLTEVVPIAVTALAIAPLLVLAGVAEPETTFRHYADPLLFLFIGSFMLAESMRRHGLDRRFARAILSLSIVRGAPWRSHVAILVAATFMSMWISNTATCAIFLPILLGLPGLERTGDRDPATRPLLALGFVCSTGGLGTLVGTPPNLITVRLLGNAGIHIGFVEWLAIGLPAALLLSASAVLVTLRREPGASIAPEVAPSLPWSRGEIATAICFGLAALGWTVPSIAEAAGVPGARDLAARLHPGVVAILACVPLFVIPDPARREGAEGAIPRVLPWSDAVRIDWGVILLFGGGIALGSALEDTGLASVASRAVVAATGPTDVWTLAVIACAVTIVLSEVASNTAAANMLVPLVIALARELDVSPIPPALAVGVGASIGFMLPIATAANAMVYATGRVPQREMVKTGIVLDVVCFVIVIALLRAICPLMGWD